MPNPVVHFEIISKEAKALQSFYGKTFGWKIKNMKPMDYGLVDTGASPMGGIGAPMGRGKGWVTFYVGVKSIAKTLKSIEKAGGKTIMGPMQVPNGPLIAQFRDPAGNRIGLVQT
ncbi:MAG: VOC family protein [Proteobacteria bacterium]|nr:VOC family protein [Pseudomonadota bacterium]MBI3497511.1 VOC family protein [Pseudomonadota bacterium]